MKKIGVIDYYLDQYHFENYPTWIREASGGESQIVYAWAKMDKPDGKTNAQCCAEQGIELLDDVNELIEKSDCLIVMSPDNPEMHEELCALPLASGKPTYVDKTFAVSREIALRIVDMARRGNTPFFSTSALRYSREYLLFYKYGLTGSLLSTWLPALLGQGVNSSIFVLVFYQFFAGYPKSYDEAARLDNAVLERSGCFVALCVSAGDTAKEIISSYLG